MNELPVGNDPRLQQADIFYAGALRRIRRTALSLGVLAAVVIWARFGYPVALGFLVGCGISYVNFVWLERVIDALAHRVTETGQPAQTRGIVLRFLLRYGFIAIACFAILISFKSSFYGFLGGLFLSVAAILCEAAYEGLVAVHKGL